MNKSEKIVCFPATQDRWEDLEQLFGKQGAYWGCWCMYWRYTNKEFNNTKPLQRKTALKQAVNEGSPSAPGLLAFIENKAVGWCAISPRQCYSRLVKSRVIKPIDEEPVWSIVCFFIHKDFRGRKVASALIKASIDYVAQQGAPSIEVYPADIGNDTISEDSAYVGTVPMFLKAGFKQVGTTKAKSAGKPRIIMRYIIK